MIRNRIKSCVFPALLIVFSGLSGVVDKVEAQITLSTSIEEIFSGTTVVEDLKANEEVKTIVRAKRDELLEQNASAVTNSNDRTDEQENLMWNMYNSVGSDIERKIIKRYSGEMNQKVKFSDPEAEDGMAVRFAPSEEDLFGTSP